jgi:hypothetical protein
VRDRVARLPPIDEYAIHGIELEQPPQVQVFELCRFLADITRDEMQLRENDA